MKKSASGPLSGLRIVELAALGPAPFAGMVLADYGADVLLIDRPQSTESASNLLRRGRRSIVADLKKPEGVEVVLRLVERADALIEGFRPGVTERLGLGPDVCRARNPRLVYARVTGWGQEGPLSQAAGHDLNYIALAGVLHSIGSPDAPAIPLNLLGDFAGGGLMVALGIAAALLERQESGEGQVIDVAMVDGAALLTSVFHPMPGWLLSQERATNMLDGGAHFYNVYETADEKFVAIGSIEPQFYTQLMERLNLAPEEFPHMERAAWPSLRERLSKVFLSKTRDEWTELLEGTDVCFAPVLPMSEAYEHPHNLAREVFVEVSGVRQPAPAPRFSRTPARIEGPPPTPGENTAHALADWGFDPSEVGKLRASGAIS